eukprot:779063_1
MTASCCIFVPTHQLAQLSTEEPISMQYKGGEDGYFIHPYIYCRLAHLILAISCWIFFDLHKLKCNLFLAKLMYYIYCGVTTINMRCRLRIIFYTINTDSADALRMRHHEKKTLNHCFHCDFYGNFFAELWAIIISSAAFFWRFLDVYWTYDCCSQSRRNYNAQITEQLLILNEEFLDVHSGDKSFEILSYQLQSMHLVSIYLLFGSSAYLTEFQIVSASTSIGMITHQKIGPRELVEYRLVYTMLRDQFHSRYLQNTIKILSLHKQFVYHLSLRLDHSVAVIIWQILMQSVYGAMNTIRIFNNVLSFELILRTSARDPALARCRVLKNSY